VISQSLRSQPAAALGRLVNNRAATSAPLERLKGKQSYDSSSQTRKVGMPSLSIPKGVESRQSRKDRSEAPETLKFVIAPNGRGVAARKNFLLLFGYKN